MNWFDDCRTLPWAAGSGKPAFLVVEIRHKVITRLWCDTKGLICRQAKPSVRMQGIARVRVVVRGRNSKQAVLHCSIDLPGAEKLQCPIPELARLIGTSEIEKVLRNLQSNEEPAGSVVVLCVIAIGPQFHQNEAGGLPDLLQVAGNLYALVLWNQFLGKQKFGRQKVGWLESQRVSLSQGLAAMTTPLSHDCAVSTSRST